MIRFGFLQKFQFYLSHPHTGYPGFAEELELNFRRDEISKLGIPGWQVRHFLKILAQAKSPDRDRFRKLQKKFDSDFWPEILRNYMNGPACDLYYGLPAAVFGLAHKSRSRTPSSRKILTRMADEMIEIKGIYGWQKIGQETPTIDLGIPHGISGGILAISLLCGGRPTDSLSADLLKKIEKSFELLFHLGKIEKVKMISTKRHPLTGGRIGWCRSDLSTGIALTIAGNRLGKIRMKRLGLQYLNRAKTNSMVKLKTDNPYLCHGSAGNAYLLKLAHELTGDPWFLQNSQILCRATEELVCTGQFPRMPQKKEYHLLDLRNCNLIQTSFENKMDRRWDLVFGFRDPALEFDALPLTS